MHNLGVNNMTMKSGSLEKFQKQKTMKNIFKTALMALMGIVLFSACEDDRDSNPVLNTSGDVTFHLNAPEIGTALVDLASSEGIELTWNQPVLKYIFHCLYSFLADAVAPGTTY